MSRQIQIRRGTATEHENFTGAIGEVTMDTTNKTLRVHDGETLGGTQLARHSDLPPACADYVIESQMPTAENNYTWYRKYKSGWIEQGGEYRQAIEATTVTFPIAMSDTNYTLLLNLGGTVGINDSVGARKCVSKTTTSIITIGTYVQNSSTHYDSGSTTWYVCGIGA